MPKRVDWYDLWVQMGWDMEGYNRFMNAGESDRHRRPELLRFVLAATTDELTELVDHIKNMSSPSFAGLIKRLESMIDEKKQKALL